MKVFRKLILIGITFFMFLSLPLAVHGEVITPPYLVNGQIHPTQAMMRNLARMFFVQTINFEYNSGKILLTFNDGGTGNIFIGDTIYIHSFTTGQSFSYKASDERCVTNEFRSVIEPIDITHLMSKGMNAIQIRFDDRCGMLRPMGQIYLVNIEKDEPKPFLSLPWDYAKKGLTFTEAALSMTSFFDHEYPLLSSNLNEPSNNNSTIVKFDNSQRLAESYSSHDGYDYARKGQALLGEPVLAAASGWATYVNSCPACGNMILIDHEGGYQSRYLHLQKDDLITNKSGYKIWVQDRQEIGKIGATGNVTPSGNSGAHIHFGLIEDKNRDGNFDDNIPDGFTDPFGWQPTDGSPDPWESYSFIQNGQSKQGNKSFYLWKLPLSSMRGLLSQDQYGLSAKPFSVTFNPNDLHEPLMVEIKPSVNPLIGFSVDMLGYAIQITAKNFIDSVVKDFTNFFTLEMSLAPISLSSYDLSAVSLYSSQDGINWMKEPSHITILGNTLSALVNHLSYFAFAAEQKPSELSIFFDPTTFELKTDNIPMTITNLDKSGTIKKLNIDQNNLSVIIKEKKKTDFHQLYIDSIEYFHNDPKKTAKNYFAMKRINQNNSDYQKLLQVFEIPDQVKIKLDYSYKKNQTLAQVILPGQDTQKTLFTGLRILKIYSQKGELTYTF